MLYKSIYKWLSVGILMLIPCLVLFANDSIGRQAETQGRIRPAIFDSILWTKDKHIAPLVCIHQDSKIEDLIAAKIAGITERSSTTVQGFRVQAFSSNTQQTAKSEAFRVEKLIDGYFPDLEIYVQYQPPFWKVRIGNFRTMAEANILREQLVKKLPAMQGDIYPVRDMIIVSE